MKFHVVADYAESFSGAMRQDHQSKQSIDCIIDIVKDMGYDCDYFGGVDQLMRAHLQNCEFEPDEVMLNFSDGLTQTYRLTQSAFLMELLEVPYSGHDPFALSLATNKHYSKMIVEGLGQCRVPEGCLITRDNPSNDRLSHLPYPCIVKPNLEGGSLGITQDSLVDNSQEAQLRANELLKEYREVLIEEFIQGIDITNLLIGNPGNFRINEGLSYFTNGSYFQGTFIRDFDAKANAICEKHSFEDAGLSPLSIEKTKRTSEMIFEAIGSRDLARIDYRIDAEGNLVFLELNALPILEPGDPFSAIYKEMTFGYMIANYVEAAICRIFS